MLFFRNRILNVILCMDLNNTKSSTEFNISNDLLHDTINIVWGLSLSMDNEDITHLLNLLVCYRDISNQQANWVHLQKLSQGCQIELVLDFKNNSLYNNLNNNKNTNNFAIYFATFIYIISSSEKIKILCQDNEIKTEIKFSHNIKKLFFLYCERNNIEYEFSDHGIKICNSNFKDI